MRLIVVPTGQSCLLFLRTQRDLTRIDEVDHPDGLAQVLMRFSTPVQVVLAGLDAPAAWIEAGLDFAGLLVIPEPWLAAAGRSAPERRARLADRIAQMHTAARIIQYGCDPHLFDPQLSLAIPF